MSRAGLAGSSGARRRLRRRHIGPSKTDKQAMIKALGLASMDDLVERVVPSGIYVPGAAHRERPHRATALADLRDSGQEQI